MGKGIFVGQQKGVRVREIEEAFASLGTLRDEEEEKDNLQDSECEGLQPLQKT